MSWLAPCPGCGRNRKADEGHHLCRECEGYPAHTDTAARLVVENDDLRAERDICAEKHCERPTDYGATYNVGGVRVEMYLCEEHFDALGEWVLDDSRVAERDQWESQNEQLGFQLMDIAAERDELRDPSRLKVLLCEALLAINAGEPDYPPIIPPTAVDWIGDALVRALLDPEDGER